MASYYVDKNNGTVVAVSQYDRYGIINDLKRKVNPHIIDQLWMVKFYLNTKKNRPDVVKGIARLSQSDTWDEKIGKDVASLKMSRKKHKRYIKEAEELKAELVKAIDAIDEIIDEHSQEYDFIQKQFNTRFLGEE